jgi:hypothetical protein
MSVNGRGTLDPIERMTAELRETIAAERVARIDAERLVADSRERERRLQRALTALAGERPGVRAKSAAKSKTYKWTVSEERVQEALTALRTIGAQPASVSEVSALTHSSTETVRRALDVLRERELVRLAGHEKKRGSRGRRTTLYALMPGADDGA